MPRHFRLPNSNVSAMSVDGVEHRASNGLLVVHTVTPNLLAKMREIGATEHVAPTPTPVPVAAAEPVEPPEPVATDPVETETEPGETEPGETERESLLTNLQQQLGRPIDRRRSLKQLRKMQQGIDALAAKSAAAPPVLATG